MNFISIPAAAAQDHSPNLEDLCVAMFLEGARVLGVSLNAPISFDDQAKILRAAHALGEKLELLLEFQNAAEPTASELPN